MSNPIEKLREHFNGRPVPEGVKCLAEEREKVNAMIDAVEAENAELRELAAEIYEDQCDDCDKWKYRDRMRELGVEVG